MQKEFAGNDLATIRAELVDEGFTGEVETKENGFTLYKPWNDLPAHECSQIVVWPRKEGGYYMEEY